MSRTAPSQTSRSRPSGASPPARRRGRLGSRHARRRAPGRPAGRGCASIAATSARASWAAVGSSASSASWRSSARRDIASRRRACAARLSCSRLASRPRPRLARRAPRAPPRPERSAPRCGRSASSRSLAAPFDLALGAGLRGELVAQPDQLRRGEPVEPRAERLVVGGDLGAVALGRGGDVVEALAAGASDGANSARSRSTSGVA